MPLQGRGSARTQVTRVGSGTKADYLHLHLPRPAAGGGARRSASLGQFAQPLEQLGFALGLGTFSRKGYRRGLDNLGPTLRWDGASRPGPGQGPSPHGFMVKPWPPPPTQGRLGLPFGLSSIGPQTQCFGPKTTRGRH